MSSAPTPSPQPAPPSFAVTAGDQHSAGMAADRPVINVIMVFGREKDDTKMGRVTKQVEVPACGGDL